MAIKTFTEYQVDNEQLFNSESAYNAGVKEASDHFEGEKIKIHEYYDAKIRELMGNKKKPKTVKKNNGKLA